MNETLIKEIFKLFLQIFYPNGSHSIQWKGNGPSIGERLIPKSISLSGGISGRFQNFGNLINYRIDYTEGLLALKSFI